MLWSFYGFRYELRANHLAMNPPYAQFVKSLSRPNDAWLLSTVGRFHLLPESYLYGLADVRNMSDFYTSYAFGKIYPKGVWFYFPVAFAIKSSLSFLILLLLTIWAMPARKLTAWREILFLTHSAGVLSFCRHGGGDEHRLATHFADIRFSDRSNQGSGLDVDPGEPALGVRDCRAADFSGGIHDADVTCVHGVCQ
jgi:hypothetical protein